MKFEDLFSKTNAPSALKTGLGLLQTGAGLLTKKPKRPTYTIPTAVTQAAQATQQQANVTQRPGASAAQAVINTNTANTVDAIQNVGGSASNVMQGLMNAQSQENRAMLNETARNEAFRYQGFQDKIRSLQMLGEYQSKKWQWDQGDRYIEKRDRRDSLINAGITNTIGGAEDIASMELVKRMIAPDIPSNDTSPHTDELQKKIEIKGAQNKLELQSKMMSNTQRKLRSLGINQRNLAFF